MRELKKNNIAATVTYANHSYCLKLSVSSNIYTEKIRIGSAGIEKPVTLPKRTLEENIEKMKKKTPLLLLTT